MTEPALESLVISSSSAGESKANTLMATTTGTPNFFAFSIWMTIKKHRYGFYHSPFSVRKKRDFFLHRKGWQYEIAHYAVKNALKTLKFKQKICRKIVYIFYFQFNLFNIFQVSRNPLIEHMIIMMKKKSTPGKIWNRMLSCTVQNKQKS